LSTTVGVAYVIVAEHPTEVVALAFAGQLIVGTWVSETVTENEQLAVFPDGSVTT